MKDESKHNKRNATDSNKKKRRWVFPPELAEILKHPSDVAFIDVANNEVCLHYPYKEKLFFRISLKRVKGRLRGKKWVDAHKSFAINTAHTLSSELIGSFLKVRFKDLNKTALVTKRKIKLYMAKGGK